MLLLVLEWTVLERLVFFAAYDGVSLGDPGNWGMEGTSNAELVTTWSSWAGRDGGWTGAGDTTYHRFYFTEPNSSTTRSVNVTFDVIQRGGDTGTVTLYGFRSGVLVQTVTASMVSTNTNGTTQNVDNISLSGVDEIRFNSATTLGFDQFVFDDSSSLSPSTQTMNGAVGTALTSSTALTASGFSGAVTYSISPTLPSGLSLNTSTGVISGTPLAAQSATTYTITGAGATSGSATSSVSITVSTASDPTVKADVMGGVESTASSAVKFSSTSIKPVNNRMSWLRQNRSSTQTSRQGIKVSFADPLIDAYVNGTQSGLSDLAFNEAAAATALTQVASNVDAAISSLKDKPVEVVMAEMKEIFGTVNLNPTAGALVGDWSVWTEGQITIGKTDATGTTAAQDTDSFNIALGMDRPYGDLGLIGVALNLGKDDVDVGSSGSGITSDNMSVSFYNAKELPNKLGLETQVGFGKMAIDTTRGDGAQTLTGNRDAQMIFGSIALVDEPLAHGSATITPHARGEWAYIELDGYAESGGSLALNYDKQHINRYMLFLGSDVSYDTTFGNGKLKPFAEFEYGLDLTHDSDVGMNYVGSSTTYSTTLEKSATSNVMVRLGADYQGKDGVTSTVSYERQEALGAGFSNTLKLQVNVPLN